MWSLRLLHSGAVSLILLYKKVSTNTAPAPAGGPSQEKEKNVYEFLGAAAAASGRPDKIRPYGGGLSGAARCRGTVSVHIVAGQRVSGG